MSEIFFPDGARAVNVYATVLRRLSESIAAIVAAMPVAPEKRASWSTIAERIPRQGRPGVAVFATYHELVSAVERDDVEAAILLLDRIDAAVDQPPGPFAVSWAGVGAEERQLYLRALNADPTTPVAFAAPDAAIAAAAIRTVGEALAELDRSAPEIAAEIRGLLTQIVLVAGTAGSDGRFDGATTFYCWGALFLNAEEHQSLVDMIDGLAHESAHALLYGLALGGPLVTNPVTERHPSPLRRDLRHLDGIFHATFVSARMHLAHSRILAGGRLTKHQQEAARHARATSAAAFAAGLRTLRDHARFTPLGAELIDSAERYMNDDARISAEPATETASS
ncbi:MAG TPA: hypothetical protein GX405_18595 [Rhizobiales bacterium]|nr:hypothetical protein [Hyphomicrobiales bacterium]